MARRTPIANEIRATHTATAGHTHPVNILLQGIVGSTAYGLAGPDSDVKIARQ
ncbi:MAG TPA: hypothetical protein VGJ07_19770 [Rugosimonospora sp.]